MKKFFSIQNLLFDKLEKCCLLAESSRGPLHLLHKQGSLDKGALSIKNSLAINRPIVITTGFPCIKEEISPIGQETDGIAGAIAILRAVGPKNAVFIAEKEVTDIICKCLEALEDKEKYQIWSFEELLVDESIINSVSKRLLNKEYQIVCIERAG